MSETRVVNLRTDPYDVYIGRHGRGRDGYFGNPFTLPYGLDGPVTRQEVLDKYRVYFHDRLVRDPEFRRRVLALKGKTLGCFCKPKPCHGDVIAEFLNR